MLTRGAVVEDNTDDEVALARVAKVANDKKARVNNRIKRTYLPTEPLKVNTVKMNFVPVLDQIKEKYNAGLNK